MAASDQFPHSRVYREQGATGIVVASGGRILVEGGGTIRVQGASGIILDASGRIDAASGSIILPGTLRQGFIDLVLGAAWEVSSADSLNALTSGTNPSFGRVNAGTDPKARIAWSTAAGSLDPIQWDVDLPPDVATASGLTIALYAEGASANATNEVSVGVFFGVGDANAGTTVALTSTPGYRTVQVASGDVLPNTPLAVIVTPSGHASGAITLYGGRVIYNRLSS